MKMDKRTKTPRRRERKTLNKLALPLTNRHQLPLSSCIPLVTTVTTRYAEERMSNRRPTLATNCSVTESRAVTPLNATSYSHGTT